MSLTDAEIEAEELRIWTRKLTPVSQHPALALANEYAHSCDRVEREKFQTRGYYDAMHACDEAWENLAAALAASTPAASPTLLEMLIVSYGRAQRDMGYADAKGDEKGLSKNAGRADQDMAQIRGMLSAFAASTTPEPSPLVAPKPLGNVKPDTDKQVFFYEQDFYVLSNFSAFSLEWDGIRFDTSEAAYHWMKFPLSPGIRTKIQYANSAHDAFKIAEHFKGQRRGDWDGVKIDIMRNILRAKTAQHEYVRRKLLATGDRELIEDSWRDDFWGWGPNRDGQNMLGKLWMEVRAELRAEGEA